MSKLTAEQIIKVKGQGFLRNRGTDLFSGRIVAPGSVFTAEDFKNISVMAEKFGNGKALCTARQSVEIPGIPFEKIEEIQKFAAEHNLIFGGTGNKIRPVAACKGTTCVYGNCDTQSLAKEIFEKYYLGWSNISLPHKFKITVGGCPNSCMKPSLNDFGIEGHRIPTYTADDCRGCKLCMIEQSCPSKAAKLIDGKLSINENICKTCGVCVGKCPFKAVSHDSKTVYKIFIGGTWGKTSRPGTALSRMISEDEIFPILEKTLLWFRENAYLKERLGAAIDRIGIAHFENAIFSDDLLNRKDEILTKALRQR